MITKSAAKLVGEVGRHNALPDSAFDAKELKRGREVEHEHNAHDPAVQEAIAKDHLSEIPDYYSRLDRMEAEGKAALKKEASAPLPPPVAAAAGKSAFGFFNILRWAKKFRKIHKVLDRQEKQKKKQKALIAAMRKLERESK